MSLAPSCDHYYAVELHIHSIEAFPDFYAGTALDIATAFRATGHTEESHVKAICGKVRGCQESALCVISSIVRPLFRRRFERALI